MASAVARGWESSIGNLSLASLRQHRHHYGVSQAMESTPPATRPEAHMSQALAAVVCASLAFAASMAALGITGHMDSMMADAFRIIRPEGGFLELSIVWIWLASGSGSLVVASVLLHTPGWWRRLVFLIASIAVTTAWAPALALAALRPAIAIPVMAVIAAGAGSLFYMSRHQMPSDPADETR